MIPNNSFFLHFNRYIIPSTRLNLQFFLVTNRRQKIFSHIILPITQHPVSLNLLVPQIHILDIHARIVRVVPKRHLQKFLSKQIFRTATMRCLSCRIYHMRHRLVSSHWNPRFIRLCDRNDILWKVWITELRWVGLVPFWGLIKIIWKFGLLLNRLYFAMASILILMVMVLGVGFECDGFISRWNL